MPADAPKPTTRRAVDEVALRRVVARMHGAARAPWLHGEVASRMAERLAIVRQTPRSVVDWWPRIGGGAAALKAACPGAHVQAVRPEHLPPLAAPWWRPERWLGRHAELAAEALKPGRADLVWANMMLHDVADPLETMRQWHRALRTDGFLMFSTLGPGTLGALRALYQSRAWGPPMAPLPDMHDLGDMLVEAGFADPVMDQETIALSWRNADEAVVELRSLGANVDPARQPGCRTPRWRDELLAALAGASAAGSRGRVELSFEIVYGHAFRPPPRAAAGAASVVSVDDMRAMLRARRPRRP